MAELSALADGTLKPEDAAMREPIFRSTALRRRYERELLAVAAIRPLRSDRAPARLRMAVAALVQPVRARRRTLPYRGALTTAVVAVVATVILLLPSGGPAPLTVSQAAALALRGPVMGPPMPAQGHGAHKLGQDVGELYFPDWSRFRWTAVGQRVDLLNHRLAVTVFYESRAARIAYTIVAAPPLRWPGTTKWSRRGVEFQGFTSGGRMVVTWRRAGYTCILSGAGVSAPALSRLALSG
jgi:hypothetical protein